MSKKRAKELAIYRSLKAYLLKRAPFCECPTRNGASTCMNPSTELHHMRGRIGAMLCDERYLLPVCQECHAFIHANGKWARQHELLK